MKHSNTPQPSDTIAYKLITGMCAQTIEHSVMTGLIVEILFMLFSVYNTM